MPDSKRVLTKDSGSGFFYEPEEAAASGSVTTPGAKRDVASSAPALNADAAARDAVGRAGGKCTTCAASLADGSQLLRAFGLAVCDSCRWVRGIYYAMRMGHRGGMFFSS